ncbi:MAG: TonB-dependent receptor [Luminiphilus sp.]|nr:TonB-dependent receptor [Luminiphilus sp.]
MELSHPPKNANILKRSVITAAVTAAVASSVAIAQEDNGAGAAALEEVVVTGTKRDISQQDLPIAVSTITAEQLSKTFQNSVTELAQFAPNVTLTPQNGFNAIAGGMRGTGFISILVTKDPSVGITVDDFAFNHVQSQFIEVFDIEQVEIFRGPQGTLFGKNTTAGAIAFTTVKPDVGGEVAGNVEVNCGRYASNDSDLNKFKFALNVPLGDTLAARISVIRDYSDGYYSNTKPMGGTFTCFVCSDGLFPTPGNPSTAEIKSTYPTTGDGSDIGGKDVLAGKLKFRWEPSDWYEADLIFEYLDDQSETVATANETPGNEGYVWPAIGFPGIEAAGVDSPFTTGQSYTQNAIINMSGGHQVEASGIYLNQAFTLGDYQLKSITGMRDQDEILASTYTGEAYTSLYDASRNTKREQFQQEFRLASQFDGPFNWVGGVAAYRDDVEFIVFGNLGFFGPLAATNFYDNRYEVQETTQDRTAWAAYADGSFDVTEQLTISAGVRYTEDKKDFQRFNLGTADNPVSNIIDLDQYQGPYTNPLPESAFGNVQKNSKTFDKVTYRLVADYRFTDEIMAYASFATGFVAGGFSETCGSEFSCSPYDSEENENFEVGLKSDLLDGTLRLNLAAFNTEYENLQRDTVVTIQDAAGNTFQETVSVNEGTSTARGIEAEFQWAVTDNFRLDGMMGYLDHEYDDYRPGINPADLGLPEGAAINPDLSGLRVPFSPELTYALGATFFQDLRNGATVTYNLNMHYQDDAETSPFPANFQGADASGSPVIVQKANTQMEERTLVNGYITYTGPNGGVEVSVYGKNLGNETYRVAANPVATLWNFTRHGAPREYGVQIGYNF